MTPAISIGRYWKYFNYQLGIELPLHLRGDGKGLYIQTYNGYNTSGQNIQKIYYNPKFAPGGIFIGLSLFGNISININRFSIGMESSAGIIYTHEFIPKASLIPNHRIGSLLYYPSILFSYQF